MDKLALYGTDAFPDRCAPFGCDAARLDEETTIKGNVVLRAGPVTEKWDGIVQGNGTGEPPPCAPED